MYRNEVSYVFVYNAWLPASHVIIDLSADPIKQSIRSLDGAFVEGDNLKRTMREWESEEPATYNDILAFGPDHTVHQAVYRQVREKEMVDFERRRRAEAEAAKASISLAIKIAIPVILVILGCIIIFA